MKREKKLPSASRVRAHDPALAFRLWIEECYTAVFHSGRGMPTRGAFKHTLRAPSVVLGYELVPRVVEPKSKWIYPAFDHGTQTPGPEKELSRSRYHH